MGFRVAGESELGSYLLFMYMGTSESCSMVAGRQRVLGKRYCSPPHRQARLYSHSSHLDLEVCKLLRNEWLETQSSSSKMFQNSCPELFIHQWKGLWSHSQGVQDPQRDLHLIGVLYLIQPAQSLIILPMCFLWVCKTVHVCLCTQHIFVYYFLNNGCCVKHQKNNTQMEN